MSKLKEECGVFGIFDNSDAAVFTALGLHALQHRGQESCGIVSYDGKNFYSEKRLGLVGDNFTGKEVIKKLIGRSAIGHNRYSTTGDNLTKNIQPFFADLHLGGISIAHNGNLTNAITLRKQLIKEGSIFQTTSDTETIVQLTAKSKRIKILDKIMDALFQIQGGYALVILTTEELIGVRDPMGIRPLIIGKVKNSYVLASETCALDIIGAKFVREVENGEIVVINKKGLKSLKPFPKIKARPCVFEYIYFARPDSMIGNKSVYDYRKNLGFELAKESHTEADMIVPVPDSGVSAAIGYSQKVGKSIEMGLIRNHYIGRTFIEPTQKIRSLGVKLKHNPNKSLIKGRKIILIDDSIVRGTTCLKIIKMLYDSGAKEIHLRIACPPIKYPDFYGIDMPQKKDLIAANKNVEQIKEYMKVKTLKFLSIDGLYRALGHDKRNSIYPQYTDHYFTGEYPIHPLDQENKKNSNTQLSLLSKISKGN